MKVNLSDFYNHEKFMQDVKEGTKIINNSNFSKYKNERLRAIKNFKVGEIYKMRQKAYNVKITAIKDDNLILQVVTKTGRAKKGFCETFENPVIFQKNIIKKVI